MEIKRTMVDVVPSLMEFSAGIVAQIERSLKISGNFESFFRYYTPCGQQGILHEAKSEQLVITNIKEMLNADNAINFQTVKKIQFSNTPYLVISSESRKQRHILLYRMKQKNGQWSLSNQIVNSDMLLHAHFDLPYLLVGIDKQNDLFRSIELLNLIVSKEKSLPSIGMPATFAPLATIWQACIDCHDTDLSSLPGNHLQEWFIRAMNISKRTNNKKMERVVDEGWNKLASYADEIFGAENSQCIVDGVEFCHTFEDKVYKHCEVIVSALLKEIQNIKQIVLN